MSEYDSAVVEKKRGLPGWLIWALVLFIVFLLGFVPMWWKLRQANIDHAETQKILRKAELRNQLSTAIVEARNGEYETARQNLSGFYTNLTSEIDKGDEGFLTAAQRDKLKGAFTNRDNNITLLAQRDPASGERLTDTYRLFRSVVAPEMPTTAKPETTSPTNSAPTVNSQSNTTTNAASSVNTMTNAAPPANTANTALPANANVSP